ncbi:ELMO/CED-12 family protein [Besnoitia besnoiti]|uniref:ELMO/CED-12 family protein n=1 Tax=Besnoitia besnoiti TaxID=94643 RepID=A0A2A9M6D8_BESBE|nr:ELMO/CED-12 family protein [Besnoitia besnoiti]PFH31213.1 ELMO/CED-12 family protein [Besnoitia besnoiti]
MESASFSSHRGPAPRSLGAGAAPRGLSPSSLPRPDRLFVPSSSTSLSLCHASCAPSSPSSLPSSLSTHSPGSEPSSSLSFPLAAATAETSLRVRQKSASRTLREQASLLLCRLRSYRNKSYASLASRRATSDVSPSSCDVLSPSPFSFSFSSSVSVSSSASADSLSLNYGGDQSSSSRGVVPLPPVPGSSRVLAEGGGLRAPEGGAVRLQSLLRVLPQIPPPSPPLSSADARGADLSSSWSTCAVSAAPSSCSSSDVAETASWRPERAFLSAPSCFLSPACASSPAFEAFRSPPSSGRHSLGSRGSKVAEAADAAREGASEASRTRRRSSRTLVDVRKASRSPEREARVKASPLAPSPRNSLPRDGNAKNEVSRACGERPRERFAPACLPADLLGCVLEGERSPLPSARLSLFARASPGELHGGGCAPSPSASALSWATTPLSPSSSSICVQLQESPPLPSAAVCQPPSTCSSSFPFRLRFLHTVAPTTGTSPPGRSARASSSFSSSSFSAAFSPLASLSGRRLGSKGSRNASPPSARPSGPQRPPPSCGRRAAAAYAGISAPLKKKPSLGSGPRGGRVGVTGVVPRLGESKCLSSSAHASSFSITSSLRHGVQPRLPSALPAPPSAGVARSIFASSSTSSRVSNPRRGSRGSGDWAARGWLSPSSLGSASPLAGAAPAGGAGMKKGKKERAVGADALLGEPAPRSAEWRERGAREEERGRMRLPAYAASVGSAAHRARDAYTKSARLGSSTESFGCFSPSPATAWGRGRGYRPSRGERESDEEVSSDEEVVLQGGGGGKAKGSLSFSLSGEGLDGGRRGARGERDPDEASAASRGRRRQRKAERDQRAQDAPEGESRGQDRLTCTHRETHAAAVAAAAVEGFGDTSLKGETPDRLLAVQRSCFSGVCKWLQHRFYGRGELERLCSDYSPHEVERVVLQSKALSLADKQRLLFLTNPPSFEEGSQAGSARGASKASSASSCSVESQRLSSEFSYFASRKRREVAPRGKGARGGGEVRAAAEAGPSAALEEEDSLREMSQKEIRRGGSEKRNAAQGERTLHVLHVLASRGSRAGHGREGDEEEAGRRMRGRDEEDVRKASSSSSLRVPECCRSSEKKRGFWELRMRGSRQLTAEEGERRGEEALLILTDDEERLREMEATDRVWGCHTEERAVLEECVEEVQRRKLVKNAEFFRIGFLRNLAALRGVTFAIQHLGTLQQKTVESGDVRNLEKFSRLWGLLMPHHRLPGRICKEWKELGFQGEDPATDFRGCGELGLDSLVFLASRFPSHARCMLEASRDSRYWYSFAITCINVTSWLCEWLFQRRAQVIFFFFTTHTLEAVELTFHYLFVYVFTRFHEFWFVKKPASIMEFPFVAGEFKNTCRFPASLPACALVSPRGVCSSDDAREKACCYAEALRAYQRGRQREEARDESAAKRRDWEAHDSAQAPLAELREELGSSDADAEEEDARADHGDRRRFRVSRERRAPTRLRDKGGRTGARLHSSQSSRSQSDASRDSRGSRRATRRRGRRKTTQDYEEERSEGRGAGGLPGSAEGWMSAERKCLGLSASASDPAASRGSLPRGAHKASRLRTKDRATGAPERRSSPFQRKDEEENLSEPCASGRKGRNASQCKERGTSTSRSLSRLILSTTSSLCFGGGGEKKKGKPREESDEEDQGGERQRHSETGSPGDATKAPGGGPRLGDCPCCRGWIVSPAHLTTLSPKEGASLAGRSPLRRRPLPQRERGEQEGKEAEGRSRPRGSSNFWRSRSLRRMQSYLPGLRDKEGSQGAPGAQSSSRFRFLRRSSSNAAQSAPEAKDAKAVRKQSRASPRFSRLLSSVARKTDEPSNGGRAPRGDAGRKAGEKETDRRSACALQQAKTRTDASEASVSSGEDARAGDASTTAQRKRESSSRNGFARRDGEADFGRERERERTTKGRRRYRHLRSTSRSSRHRESLREAAEATDEENFSASSRNSACEEDRSSLSSGEDGDESDMQELRGAQLSPLLDGRFSLDRHSAKRNLASTARGRAAQTRGMHHLPQSYFRPSAAAFQTNAPSRGAPNASLSRISAPLDCRGPLGSRAAVSSSFPSFPGGTKLHERGAGDPWRPASDSAAGGAGPWAQGARCEEGGRPTVPQPLECAGCKEPRRDGEREAADVRVAAAGCPPGKPQPRPRLAPGESGGGVRGDGPALGSASSSISAGADVPANVSSPGAPASGGYTQAPFLQGGRGLASHSSFSSASSASAATAYFTPLPARSVVQASNPQDDSRSLLSRLASSATQNPVASCSSMSAACFARTSSSAHLGPGSSHSSSAYASNPSAVSARQTKEGGASYAGPPAHAPCRAPSSGAAGSGTASYASPALLGAAAPKVGASGGRGWDSPQAPVAETQPAASTRGKSRPEKRAPFDLLS